MDKIILTDVDGVLCDWESGFNAFMESKGFEMIENGHLEYVIGDRFGIDRELGYDYVREFNNSEAISTLAPLRDSQEYVQKINSELGYTFVAVSSMSKKSEAMDRRSEYLIDNFGAVWSGFLYLDTGADKDEALMQWQDQGLMFVEDKIANCIAGANAGLSPVLMDHEYNQNEEFDPIRVKNWHAIYQLLSSN